MEGLVPALGRGEDTAQPSTVSHQRRRKYSEDPEGVTAHAHQLERAPAGHARDN